MGLLHETETLYVIDDAVVKIAETNEKLRDEIKRLKNPPKKEISISEIKEMNWWQFPLSKSI